LRDLSTLKTRLKIEFNARFSDLADVRLLGSPDGTANLLTMGGKSVLDCSEVAPQVGRRRRCGGHSDAVG
jgi:hypothetical protein